MHKVKRAIIMAAGLGKRMQPVTLTNRKPLVGICKRNSYDRHRYRRIASKMESMKYISLLIFKRTVLYTGRIQYPGVKILENPYYDTCNNVSSLYVARDHLEDVIILDGDQIIYNPQILHPEFERSGYNCIWTDTPTDEWLLNLSDNIVTSCSRTGGSHGWQLYSISRWNKEDGHKLKKHLELEFEDIKNTQIYWDDVALFCHPNDYQLGIQRMQENDIIEIDNLQELAAIDSKYERYLNGGNTNE